VTAPLPFRVRQRAALLNEIRTAAVRLFAERGFDAVTTDDIAAAVGISASTFFRHVPTKEGLLIDPLLQGISGVVAAYERRPAGESAAEALVAAIVDNMAGSSGADLGSWLAAIRSAPQLIGRVALVSRADRDRLTELAAARMGTKGRTDLRPALLVQVVLAASEFVFQRWVSGELPKRPSLSAQVESALRTVLSADW